MVIETAIFISIESRQIVLSPIFQIYSNQCSRTIYGTYISRTVWRGADCCKGSYFITAYTWLIYNSLTFEQT